MRVRTAFVAAFSTVAALAWSAPALAHCDTLDGPVVSAARKALDTGKLQGLAKVIFDRTEKGLHGHFEQVMAKKTYNPNDVEAGRAYSSAYVEFVHYAERLYDAAETMAPVHVQKSPAGHGH